MPDQQKQSPALGTAKGANWANWIAKTGQTAGRMRNGGETFANAAKGNSGLLGNAGKLLAPVALGTGLMGMHKGIGEMANAEDGWDVGRGGMRTAGGLAGTVAGGIGTAGLAGAGMAAAGGSSLLAGTAAGGALAAGGAGLAGAAAAAAPVAAVAAPIAAAIGLGFRGDSFMKENGMEHLTMGSQMSGGYDIGSGLATGMGFEEDGLMSKGLGVAGGAVGAVTGAATSVGMGVAGVATDVWDLATSW